MKNKAQELDQFYTNNNVAISCYEKLLHILDKYDICSKDKVWLEPSAGNGAFYNLLPINKLGIDIEPKIENVIEHDFLTYNLQHENYITIGNPPFGKNSSLAIKFFNKCAEVSDIIAFIVPKTFKKNSVKNKLNLYMELIEEYEIEDFSFNIEDKIVNVPCVFQVWKKVSTPREKIKPLRTVEGIVFCSKEQADIAFQRVGVNAGTIKGKERFSHIAEASHIFIQLKDMSDVEILKNIDWSEIKYNTAGNPSISKSELIAKYIETKSGK